MRKIVVMQFLTLDGVSQAPGGRDEDREEGFPYGGWQMEYWGGGIEEMMPDLDKADSILLGRKTYDIFSAYWPTAGKDVPGFGPFMNESKKYVASRTLKSVDWANSQLLGSETAGAISKLKQEPGKDIYVYGSGDLCQTLMRHHLIDEYFLTIYPLTLGTGKRFFHEGIPKQTLELTRSKTSTKGVLAAWYKTKV